MPEITAGQTTPEQQAVEAPQGDWEDKLAAKFGLSEEPQEPQGQPDSDDEEPSNTDVEPAKDEPAKDDDELSPDEIVDETQPDSQSEFELVRHGQKVRVPKEEAIRLAQMGYDYTQKSQQLADERRAFDQERTAFKAQTQLRPELIQAAARVQAANDALLQYQNVNWIQLAQQDPGAYAQHHATFTQLQGQFAGAMQQYHQIEANLAQTQNQLTEADERRAISKMFELIPQWRDEKRHESERLRVREYLQREEYSTDELKTLIDPRFIAIARKAMLYDEAVRNRASKQQQPPKSAPAVKPGAAPPRVTPQMRKQEVIKNLHQAKDPVRKRALLDDALSLKFGLK